MRPQPTEWRGPALTAALAAATTFATLLSWRGFSEHPSGFLVPLLWVCFVLAASGTLLRAWRLPAPGVLGLQALLLLLWASRTWASEESVLGWVPTADSIGAIRETLVAASDTASRYAAPVPITVDSLDPLLVVTGAGCALLVDFLACGLRRVPLAGLPLLAAYTAPVSVLGGGVSWFTFAVAAAGFVFLLAADGGQRLGQWGGVLPADARVRDSQAQEVRMAAVWPSARKIGLSATGLAVVVPVVLPTLGTGLLDGLGDGPGGFGDGVAIENPMVDMRRNLSRGEDIELVRVRTDDPAPAYLRLTVLDDFDGDVWEPSTRTIPSTNRATGEVPTAPGLRAGVSTRPTSYAVSVSPSFHSVWLPAPYPVTQIVAPGDWRYDPQTLDFVNAAGEDTAGLEYQLTALNVQPTAAQLVGAPAPPASVFTGNTLLPDDLPDWVPDLAEEVTAGAASRFERAVLLQRWFREEGGFDYSLEPAPGNGLEQLELFLGDGEGSRRGYCEQFAAAMALLARAVDIPARVAVGFLRPDRVADGWVYSAHDLHAWPELYFDGVGWVRFEPTPRAGTDVLPGYTSGSVPEPTATEAPTLTPDESRPARPDRPEPTTPEAGTTSTEPSDGSFGSLGLVAGLALLALLVGAPRLARSWVRRRRWSTASGPEVAEAAWRELRATAWDLRLPWDDRVTLRTRARELVTHLGTRAASGEEVTRSSRSKGPAAAPEAAAALERLVLTVERVRYSREPGTVDATRVREDLGRVVEALEHGASTRSRRLARWLPASLWRTSGASNESAGRGDSGQVLTESEVNVPV